MSDQFSLVAQPFHLAICYMNQITHSIKPTNSWFTGRQNLDNTFGIFSIREKKTVNTNQIKKLLVEIQPGTKYEKTNNEKTNKKYICEK